MFRGTWKLVGWVLALVVALGAGTAAAQRNIVELDGTVSLGYTQITRGTFVADPNAAPEDVPDSTQGGMFVEFRPGIAIQTGTPRVTWRAGYTFAGNLSLTGEQLGSYSNQGNASLAAQLTKFTTLTIAGSAAQGGSSFLLAQKPADAGQPELRAPDNPSLVSASMVEALAWEAGRHTTVSQSLIANVSAPQDDFAERNSALTGTLAIDRVFERDTLGLEGHASVSWLRPLRPDLRPYHSLSNALLARWNHDFTEGWNGLLNAGVEQVYTDTGSEPLAFLPTASATVRYTGYNAVGAVDFTHGTATNLQVGAVSLTDKITARGIVTLDPRVMRSIAFSAGFLHNEPLGEVDALVAAGTGNALQGDAAFSTALSRNTLLSVRYSVAYQFGQGGGLEPTLAHIVYVGVTALYRNTEKPTRALPTPGQRVDKADAEGFPVVEDAPEP
jgi:hypothetical protein